MPPKIQLPHNWRPRKYQLPIWKYLELGGKRAVAVWNRRSGKDEVGLHWTATALMERVGTYWYMLPEASQARKAIWDAINPRTGKRRIDEVFPMEIRESTRDQDMMIKFKNGSTWQVVGSDNYNSLVGSPPIGIVFSEFSLANPLCWGYLRPILLENGGWAMFNYTSRGQNHGADLYNAAKNDPEWFAEKLTVDDTKIFTQKQLDSELKDMIALYGTSAGTALFRQEYYSSFDAAVLGSVYGEWMERAENAGRMRTSIYDPALEVHTAWDLGYDDSTVIIFYQIAIDGIGIIHAHEASQQDVPYYCGYLEQMRNERGYSYHKLHNVPHDAANKTLQGNGKSIVQQAHGLGVNMRVVPASSQANQIQALRQVLGRMWFAIDDEGVAHLIKALKGYRYKYDTEKKIFSHDPIHDWTSHYADAAEVLALTNLNVTKPAVTEEPTFLHNMTANQLFWPEKEQNSYKNHRI